MLFRSVIFIGATTENPYFEVNKALVSRSRIFQLKPLNEEHLRQIAHHALTDPERGYGKRNATIDADALEHLVGVANGDARSLLNALELAVETTEPSGSPPHIRITMAIAEESIQRRAGIALVVEMLSEPVEVGFAGLLDEILTGHQWGVARGKVKQPL